MFVKGYKQHIKSDEAVFEAKKNLLNNSKSKLANAYGGRQHSSVDCQDDAIMVKVKLRQPKREKCNIIPKSEAEREILKEVKQNSNEISKPIFDNKPKRCLVKKLLVVHVKNPNRDSKFKTTYSFRVCKFDIQHSLRLVQDYTVTKIYYGGKPVNFKQTSKGHEIVTLWKN